jgi:diketogulonate reductase-like aldo/keto reductase
MPPGHPLHGCGQVGQALAKVLEDGVVTRDQLFVTSKLW